MSKFAAIFDMDGVIIDSNNAHRGAILEFLSQKGLSIDETELTENVFGRRNVDWIPYVFGRNMSEEEIQNYAWEKEALFRKIFEEDEAYVEGAAAFIYHLKRQGIPVALATSAPIDNVAFTLEKLMLQDAFESVIEESQIENGKPDPEIFLKSALALNQPIEKCVIFEDSMAGIMAAKKSGAKVVGLTTTHSAYELRDCDLVIENFKDLNMTSLSELFPGS